MWYDDRNSLALLLEALLRAGLIDEDGESIAYLIRKPWKYTAEWEHLLRHDTLVGFGEEVAR